MINILYNDLKTLISSSSLVPEEQYRITDYVTTVSKANYTSAGYKFDIVVTALTTNTLYEYATLMVNATETYFDANALLLYNIKYNVNNIIPGYYNDWVDVNGKGCIYYMSDDKGNEAPFDFKNIKYNSKFLFNNIIDGSDTSLTISEYNSVKEVIEEGIFKIPLVIFNNGCHSVTIDTNASEVSITECNNLQIGDNCKNSEYSEVSNVVVGSNVIDSELTLINGGEIGDNNNGIIATNQTNLIVKDNNTSVTLGGGNGVIIDSNNTNVTIGTKAKDVYINASKTINLGNNIEQFNISSSYDVVVADDCKLFTLNETNHLTSTSGCQSINTISNDYITLTEAVTNVNISEGLNNLVLDGTKLVGNDAKNIIQQDEKVVVINEQTNAEVVLVEDGTTTSNPNSYITDSPADGSVYGRKDGNWEEIDTSGGGGGITDAPIDGLLYGRKDGDWVVAETGISDAPSDNNLYGRKGGDWEEINAYTKTESDDKYETIENVDLLEGIVSGHTTNISSLQSNKADKATTLSGYGITDAEPAIVNKLTAFNKNFGTTAGTVSEGNHAHTFASLTSKPNTLSGYGITDTPSDNKTYGRKNGAWSEITTSGGGGISIISITWSALKALRDAGTLVPGQSYRITDYVCTTVTTDTRSAGNQFDIIVTALDEGVLSENASATYHESDTYFTNAKLESWELKYCIDNDTNRFAWADGVNGKGVIYYMKDNRNNELPYDFKNIQYFKNSVWVYTFGGATDNSLSVGCFSNKINSYITSNKQTLNNITFGTNCQLNTFGNKCYSNTFGKNCYANTFGNECYSNTFGSWLNSNTFGNGCHSNIFGLNCNGNTFGNGCYSNTFGDWCDSNTFGNGCRSNNFYHGLSGTTPKNYIGWIVLEDGVRNNNFYSNLTTDASSYLQRIRIKGLENTTTTNTTIALSTTNTKYEWVIAKNSSDVVKQYCPENLVP